MLFSYHILLEFPIAFLFRGNANMIYLKLLFALKKICCLLIFFFGWGAKRCIFSKAKPERGCAIPSTFSFQIAENLQKINKTFQENCVTISIAVCQILMDI